MSITLGSFVFDERRTSVSERIEEIGGRDARVITLDGVLEGYVTLTALENALDAVLAAASGEELVEFSVRANRRFMVRRRAFTRTTARDALAAGFTLELEAPDAREEAIAGTSIPWTLVNSGQLHRLPLGGNVPSRPSLYVTATGTPLIEPAFDVGGEGVVYRGSVPVTKTLAIDGETGHATLEGLDVTAFCEGAPPMLQPGDNTIRFSDAAESGHCAEAIAIYRARWW